MHDVLLARGKDARVGERHVEEASYAVFRLVRRSGLGSGELGGDPD